MTESRTLLFSMLFLLYFSGTSLLLFSDENTCNTSFYYYVEDGEATITGCCSCSGDALVIPKTIGEENAPVVNIYYRAFLDGTWTSVELPEGLQTIGENAFYSCNNLKSITIPGSVYYIGEQAFEDCFNLENVILNDGVEIIDSEAFSFCYNLKSITIPGSVYYIGRFAFKNCFDLETIMLNDGLEEIGSDAFISCSSLKSVTIPGSVMSIGDNAFRASGVTSVTLKSDTSPGYGMSIGMGAFRECRDLTSVTLNEGVECIGEGAFMDCDSLSEIIIPGCVTTIGRQAFANCKELWSVSLNEGLYQIQGEAFSGCKSLVSITLPASIDCLGENVFADSGIEAVFVKGKPFEVGNEFPENLVIYAPTGLKWEKYEKVGFHGATVRCGKFYCLFVNGRFRGAYPKDKEITVTAPQCLRFNGWSSESVTLTEAQKHAEKLVLVMPGNDVYLSAECERPYTPEEDFEYMIDAGKATILCCKRIETDIRIPPWLGKSKAPVVGIADNAFREGKWRSVTFPASVRKIGMSAFEDCRNLESVIINNGLEHIGENAFSRCGNLQSITIPDTVQVIGKYAFENCASLIDVTVPGSVNAIGDYAFENCIRLASVTLNEGLKEIGEEVFYKCQKLKSITIPASVESIQGNIFRQCQELEAIHVKQANKTYASVDGVLFTKDMLNLYAYPARRQGSSYTVPSTVKLIMDWAIFKPTFLKEIILPDGLLCIGAMGILFEGDSEIIIPQSVSKIDITLLKNYALYFLGPPPEVTSKIFFYILWSGSRYALIIAHPDNGWENYVCSGFSDGHQVIIPKEDKPQFIRLDGQSGTHFDDEITVKVVGKAKCPDSVLRYSTGELNSTSPIYSSPIRMSKHTVLTAAYFDPQGKMISAPQKETFERQYHFEQSEDSGLDFITYGDQIWETQRMEDQTLAAHITLEKDSYEKGILETVVQGPGILSFTWYCTQQGWSDELPTIRFMVDGITVESYDVDDGIVLHSQIIIQEPGAHVLSWHTANNGDPAEIWVEDISWNPVLPIPLNAGWSLVALTADIPDTPANHVIVQELAPFLLDMQKKEYSRACLPLSAGQVLWVYSSSDRCIGLERNESVPLTMKLPTLKKGWNAVGIYGTKNMELPVNAARSVWLWENGTWRNTKDALLTGKGYVIQH